MQDLSDERAVRVELGNLREKKPDLAAAISCYILVKLRGLRFPDPKLVAFGARDEGDLGRMLNSVDSELEKLGVRNSVGGD